MTTIEEKGEYIFVKYKGSYIKNTLFEIIKEVKKRSKEIKCYKLLGDISEMTGKVGTLDRFDFGVQGATMFRENYKIALIYRKEEINGFAETVSVNRGLNARIFSDKESAMRWLGIKANGDRGGYSGDQ